MINTHSSQIPSLLEMWYPLGQGHRFSPCMSWLHSVGSSSVVYVFPKAWLPGPWLYLLDKSLWRNLLSFINLRLFLYNTDVIVSYLLISKEHMGTGRGLGWSLKTYNYGTHIMYGWCHFHHTLQCSVSSKLCFWQTRAKTTSAYWGLSWFQ